MSNVSARSGSVPPPRSRTQQLAVLVLDGFVTLASAFAQTLDIEDVDFAAGISDHAGFLKGARHGGHAGPPYAEHFSEEFLGERKLVAARQIARAQQPPAEA